MELLNSKHDHKDYSATIPPGRRCVKRVGSDRIKLLYDIYHMQIMEATSAQPSKRISPTSPFPIPAACPDATRSRNQELNYARVCKAIAATGFQGFVAHEFLPTAIP